MRFTKYFSVLLIMGFLLIPSDTNGESRKVTIIQPDFDAILSNPIKVCMKVEGLVLEHEDNGVREGYGHHHILFSSLPANLNIPIGKNEAIHMSDGAKCRIVNLIPGQHVIRALFAYADHVPYNPAITDKILIKVK